MAKCELCGEEMPIGEEMFRYHGYSGPCPTKVGPRTKALIAYTHRRDGDDFFLEIHADGVLWQQMKFETAEERQRAHDDLLSMMRQLGASDLPTRAQ